MRHRLVGGKHEIYADHTVKTKQELLDEITGEIDRELQKPFPDHIVIAKGESRRRKVIAHTKNWFEAGELPK